MASVQELLLAAQAKQKKHPLSMLADLINAAGTGYKEGSDIKNVQAEADLRRATIAKTLIEAQQAQEEMNNGKQAQDYLRQLLGIKSEQSLRDGQAATGAPPIPTTPMDKFDKEISIDSQGKMSLKLTPKKQTGPKAPAGWRFAEDGSLEAIPGGPADLKIQTEKAKADLALAGQQEKAKNVLDTIDETLPLVSKWSTGYGSTLKNLPLTDANALAAKLKTITSNLGVDQLTEMKSASKTGASGFGQLSDKELEVITTAVTNLNQAQAAPDIVKNLNKLKTHYNNWLDLQKGINPYKKSINPGSEPPPESQGKAPAAPPAAGNGASGGKTAEQRYNELKSQGKAEADIYKQLAKEGY